ncbi:MAG: ribosome-associated translation inhibitor RaiA [Opitutales bacterium]
MNQKEIIISGNNLELTQALKNDVERKMEKIFSHDDSIVRLRIELAYSPNKHKENEFIAKGRIEIQGPDMIVKAASNDMYKSIDELTVQLARKIRRKHRLDRIKRGTIKAIDIPSSLPKGAEA